MTRIFSVLLTVLLSALAQADSLVPQAPQIAASGYILMDAASGQTLVEHNSDTALPPASLTKMMTTYVADHELARGNISLKDAVRVSVKAWRTGGSRMFIREGTLVTVEDLLKGVIISSGNDASVALAEHIAGSEETFADLMNRHADRLGMQQSHFRNATGLPAEGHRSSPRDMAILARAIINDFPEHYALYAEKSFTYNDISQNNRNLLLWRDASVDGLKTGHTEEAGYCLVASAKKDNQRLISVVFGTDSEQARAIESQKLLTWGFRFFETYHAYDAGEKLADTAVWFGQGRTLSLGAGEDLIMTIPRDSQSRLEANMTFPASIDAPIAAGSQVGEVVISLDGEALQRYPLVALHDVEQAALLTRLWHHVLRFFSNLF